MLFFWLLQYVEYSIFRMGVTFTLPPLPPCFRCSLPHGHKVLVMKIRVVPSSPCFVNKMADGGVMVSEIDFSNLQCRSRRLTKHLLGYDFITTPFIGLTMPRAPPKLSKQCIWIRSNSKGNSTHVTSMESWQTIGAALLAVGRSCVKNGLLAIS